MSSNARIIRQLGEQSAWILRELSTFIAAFEEPPRRRGLLWRARERFLRGYRRGLGARSARELLRREREKRGL